MVSPRRVSQRAPKSCKQCAKRKMRCSKDFPCTNCVARGWEFECGPEVVLLSKHLSPRPSSTRRRVGSRPESNSSNFPAIENRVLVGAYPAESSPASLDREDECLPSTESDHVARLTSTADRTLDAQRHLVPEALSSLESIVWSSHNDATQPQALTTPSSQKLLQNVQQSSIPDAFEHIIFDFQDNSLSWMHNFIHIQSFKHQCTRMRQEGSMTGTVEETLYFALLATGVYYMTPDQHRNLGLGDGYKLCEKFYRKTLERLESVDFTMRHSLSTLQAICVIVPCAHAFGESKRIIVLLATAAAIAQSMNLHRLGPDPATPLEPGDSVTREIAKRIWCFLYIQDSYLVSFRKTFCILPEACTTPEPQNCVERGTDGAGVICDVVPLSTPTRNSYMILQYRMTNIYRTLQYTLCLLSNQSAAPDEVYEAVLKADEKLMRLRREFPQWLIADQTPQSPDMSSAALSSAKFAFYLAFLHIRIKIHGSFCCLGLTDKRYFYSQVACLDSAKMIMRKYRCTAAHTWPQMWSVAPHVISAGIVMTMHLLFSSANLESDFGGFASNTARSTLAQDRQLMIDCVEMVAAMERPCEIIRRGMTMIYRLLEEEQGPRTEYRSLDSRESLRLLKEVENFLAGRALFPTIGLGISTEGLWGFDEVPNLL